MTPIAASSLTGTKARALDALDDYAVSLLDRQGVSAYRALFGKGSGAMRGRQSEASDAPGSSPSPFMEKEAELWFTNWLARATKEGRIGPDGYLRVVQDWKPRPWTFGGIRAAFPDLDFKRAVVLLVALDGTIEEESMEVQEQIIGIIREIIQQELGHSEDVRVIVRSELAGIFQDVGALAKRLPEERKKLSPLATSRGGGIAEAEKDARAEEGSLGEEGGARGVERIPAPLPEPQRGHAHGKERAGVSGVCWRGEGTGGGRLG